MVVTEKEDSRRVINDIWTGTKSDDGRPGGTTARQRVIGPGDADLPADSDEDDDDVDEDLGGVLWDDPDFPTPSTIKVTAKTFTGVQWLRPAVSNSILSS